MNIKWRPYQEDYFTAIEEAEKRGVIRQLIVQATGSGKRIQSVFTTQKYNRTLFLCHTEELIQQAYEDFNSLYPLQVGIIKGPVFEIDKKVVIGSAQTMWRRLDKIPKDYFDCVMADECHLYLAKTFQETIDYFDFKAFYGYTATPTRLDGLNFSNIIDEITFQYPIEQGINDGWLAPLDAYRIKTDIDISKVKKVAGDFNKKELSVAVDQPRRNKLIVEKYLEYSNDRQGVVFCASIQHALNVRDAFREAGISAETISSHTSPEDRASINARFKNKSIRILTNVTILAIGWDYPDLGIIMMARPTQSKALYMQMLGRGTRLKSKEYIDTFLKRNATILDFVDNSGNHKLINHWTIEDGKEVKDRVLISEEQKEYYEKKIAAKREAKIKQLYKHDKAINLFSVPPVNKIRHKGRMLELATPAQLKWLKDEGIAVDGMSYTKGQASEFITNFPAKDWMLQKLVQWKYDITKGTVTTGQYYDIKREVEERAEQAKAF